MKSLHAWLELARISNLPTVWTNVFAGWILAFGKWEWQSLIWLFVGGSLLYTGGMILNDAADVKHDREHRTERPIPSGRVSLTLAWCVAIGMLVAGGAMFVWGAGACSWLTATLVAAIVAYNLYHKQWSGSIFVMGSCRTLLYLATASAVTGTLSWREHHETIMKAIALGGYIVGLSLVARREARAHQSSEELAQLRQFAHMAVGCMGLVAPVVIGIWYAGWHREWLPVIFAADLCGVIVVALYWMWMNPRWIGKSVGLLLAFIPLVDALAVASVQIIVAVIFLMIVPLLLWAQRKIAAT